MTAATRPSVGAGADASGSGGRDSVPVRRIVDPERVVRSVPGRPRLTVGPVHRAEPGRVQILDGPVPLRPGLLAVGRVLPAHAGSEDLPIEPLRARLMVWARGSGHDSLRTRLRGLVIRPRREPHRRRLRRWWAMRPRRRPRTVHLDNLGVGLFAPGDGTRPLAGLMFRATGPTNAVLVACGADRSIDVLEDVTNVGFTWLITVSDHGVLVSAGSVAGNELVATEPACSPLALLPLPVTTDDVLAGVSVAVVGQHGFSADTIVADQRLRRAPDPGHGEQTHGGASWWDGGTGEFAASSALAEPPGLVRLRRDAPEGELTISWRGRSADVEVRYDGAQLDLTAGTQRATTHVAAGDGPVELHLVALPTTVVAHVVGTSRSARVGLRVGFEDSGELHVRSDGPGTADVVAFPRRITAPLDPPVDLLADPEWSVNQTFEGAAGASLATLTTPDGRRWRRWCGERDFVARTDGLYLAPGPRRGGRTIWALPWGDPRGAALAVGLVPAGGGRGEGAHCAAGVALGADADNVLLVNAWADDSYAGGSVSSFLRLGGWEEIYDAVWVNVGDLVRPGNPVELGVRFDGDRYLVALDGRTVLERAVSDVYPGRPPLAVSGVGILANWEWGDDSGSLVRYFRASRLRRAGKER